MDITSERREKARDYTVKAGIATMALCAVMAVGMLAGRRYGFLSLPTVVFFWLAAGFGSALAVFLLSRQNIFHYGMSFVMTTSNSLILSYAMSFIDPGLRTPFFLFFFYIVLHPAMLLGTTNGLWALFLVDASYLAMVFLTRAVHPGTAIGLEAIRVVFFTAISGMLMADLQRNLTRIGNIRRLLGRAEGGDLTPRAADREKDEIHFLGVSLNNLLENEIRIIGLITESVQALVGMAQQISSTAGELTGSITEIVKTTHEMTDNVKVQRSEMAATLETAGSLGEISRLSVEQSGRAEHFSGAVSGTAASAIGQSDEASRTIGLIRERYQVLAGQVRRFQESSAAINRIVESINAISSQINILSFNALIEATNAGEHGRGFSVVADEIQKLAKSTQSSAAEIGKLMADMNATLASIITGADDVDRAIGGGDVQIRAAAASLKDISSRVIELAAAVRAINQMTGREGKDVDKIVRQAGTADGLSRENAAAAERILAALEEQSAASQEFTAMSQELVAVSSNLEGMVRKFKIS
jgi:methyl-accepting chemotaxis protein